ncbi:MAG: hypothetical protein ACOYMW_16280 [Candidatus Competibacteraceae bacterium]
MRFDKKQLTLAVASALAAGVAGAAVPVNLDGTTPDPITYVQELNVPTIGSGFATLNLPAPRSATVLLGNTGNTLVNNTAYLRLDLSNGAVFGSNPSASAAANGFSGNIADGTTNYSINCPAAGVFGFGSALAGGGLGSAAAIIPITVAGIILVSAAAGSSAVPSAFNCFNTAGAVSIFAGADSAAIGSIRVLNKNPVTLTYGLYSALVNAQNAAGANKLVAASYVNFAPIAALQATANPVVADVAASPAFARFVGGGVAAALGAFRAGPTGATVYLANGSTGGFNDVVNTAAATPPFVFSGNFGVRAAGGVGYNGANACAPITAFGTVGDAAASNVWNNAFTAINNLCYQVNGTAAIPVADYTITFAPTALNGYTVASSTLAIGRITQNGSILIAPLVQIPASGTGSVTRLVLTNSGTTAQTATVTALGADGNAPTLDPSLASIALPAGKTIVVDLTGKITVPAGAPPRTGLRIVINAPQGAVTGYYQLYNAVSGVVSNFIMPFGS